MTLTLNLPKDLESQLKELSRQRGESLESIAHTALLYYTVVFKKTMDDLDHQKKVTRQNQLENILRFRGRFKGSLSTSEDFAARKALERDCAAAVAQYESAVIKEPSPDDEFFDRVCI